VAEAHSVYSIVDPKPESYYSAELIAQCGPHDPTHCRALEQILVGGSATEDDSDPGMELPGEPSRERPEPVASIAGDGEHMGAGCDAESSAGTLNQGVPRTVAHSRCGVETSIEAEGEAGTDRHAEPLPDVDLAIPDGEPGGQ
jgi:hypothetical protein